MRQAYFEQLQRHLEPENISIQSKTKSIAANSQHSASLHGTVPARVKKDCFRNQRPVDSFTSFDGTGLI
jgi:hypothetical protein